MQTKLIAFLLSLVASITTCQAAERTWKEATSERTLQAELLGFDGVSVTLRRTDGKTFEIDLVRLSKEDRDFVLMNPRTGLGVNCVPLSSATEILKRYNAVPPVKDGMYVLEILPETPASKAGLQVGDIIATVEGKPVRDGGFGYLDPDKEYDILIYRPHERQPTAAVKPSKAPTRIDWRRQVLAVKVLPISKLKEIAARQKVATASKKSREVTPPVPAAPLGHVPVQNMAESLTRWKEWEQQQSQMDAEKRPFELKGDRLGMTLDMFKAKYYRADHVDSPAPMCSDANPHRENPFLLYRPEFSEAGIVHARTTFPYETHAAKPNVPSIAGVSTDLYVYHFVDGRLYKITIFFSQTDFEKVLNAVKAKFGEPKARDTRTYQNSFGANFSGEVLLWNNAVSELNLFERAGRTDSSLLLVSHKELERVASDNIKLKIKPRTDDL